MPLQNGPARYPGQSYAERWAAELFLEEAAEGRESVAQGAYQSYTPFNEDQELEEAHGPHTEEEDHTAELEDGGYHEAFDEAVDEASELDGHRPSEGYAGAVNIQSDVFGSADREQQIETAE